MKPRASQVALEMFPVGQLVCPVYEKCLTYRQRADGKSVIKVCSEPNRERPWRDSVPMEREQVGIVLEVMTGRYPMLKLLLSSDRSQFTGWVLSSDVMPVYVTKKD